MLTSCSARSKVSLHSTERMAAQVLRDPLTFMPHLTVRDSAHAYPYPFPLALPSSWQSQILLSVSVSQRCAAQARAKRLAERRRQGNEECAH